MDDNTQTTSSGKSDLSPVDRISALLQAETGQPEERKEQPQGEEQELESQPELEASEAPEGQAEDDLEDMELEGKAYRVPKELKAGYLRQADYTRKTQELAEERKSATARIENARQMEQAAGMYQQQLGLIAAIDAELAQYDQGSLLRLRAEDPATYAHRVADLQLLQNHRNNAITELQGLRQQQDAAFQKELGLLKESNDKELARRIKGWDSKQAETVEKYALDYGFPREQIAQAVDWKQREILWKAMQYDNLQKAKATASDKAAKPVVTVKPGSAPGQQSQAATSAYRSAREALKKSGSMQDAARAMKGLL